jgi:ribosomal protein S6--L-glutamate ligase
LAGALSRLDVEAPVIDLGECSLRLPDRRLFHRGAPLDGLSGAVVKKLGDPALGWAVHERINLLRHLEAAGVMVLSAPDRLETAVNRYRMTGELVRAGLPIPDTVLTEDVDEAVAAIDRFEAAVLKPLYTSKGRGMVRLTAGGDSRPVLERHLADGRGPFYLQRFVKHPGRDLGVAVLDGRCLGAYWRVAGGGQWMTTILAGGRYEKADPPSAAVETAVAAARHFGLVFTGVDLMETPGGGFVVLEVSAFGGFRGLATACGIDAGALLADAVVRRLRDNA